MKSCISYALACALSAPIAAYAAGADAATAAKDAKDMAASSATAEAGDVVTLTGCVEKGADASSFHLSGAKGTDGKTEDLGLVAGPPSMKFADHVGHRVEVQGKMLDAKEAAKYQSAEKAPEPKHSENVAPKQLKVSAIKHIADSCESAGAASAMEEEEEPAE